MEAYQVEHNDFAGPLDLLLHLIEREELDITEMSLTNVADDFLVYLDSHDELPAHELADFLVVASKLLFLKSRAILPSVWMNTEEDETDLSAQLKMYKQFVDASKGIQDQIAKGKFAYAREQVVVKRDAGFYPPENAGVGELHSSFARVVERLKPLIRLPKAAFKRVMSIKEKITVIRDYIARQRKAKFKEFVGGGASKTDVIVSFLALLELVKQREVNVSQGELFDEIELHQAG